MTSDSASQNVPYQSSRLLARPRRLRDEGIRGYAWRIAELNGFSSPHHFCENLISSHCDATCSRLDQNALARLLDLNKDELHFLFDDDKPHRPVSAGVDEKHRWTPRRVCPQCLSEAKYHRLWWDLDWYSICEKHAARLVHSCNSCGKQLTWFAGQLSRCKCGADLCTSPSIRPDDSTLELHIKLMGHLAEVHPLSDSAVHSMHSTLTKSIRAISEIYQVSKYLLAGATPPLSPTKISRRDALQYLESEFQSLHRASLACEDWPKKFHQNLFGYSKLPLHQHWGRFGRVYEYCQRKALQEVAKCTLYPAFIQQAVEQFLSAHRFSDSRKEFYDYPQVESSYLQIDRKYFCTLEQCAFALKTTEEEIHWLIKEKLLPSKKMSNGRRTVTMVPRYQVKEAIEFYSKTVDRRAALAQLHNHQHATKLPLISGALLPCLGKKGEKFARYYLSEIRALNKDSYQNRRATVNGKFSFDKEPHVFTRALSAASANDVGPKFLWPCNSKPDSVSAFRSHLKSPQGTFRKSSHAQPPPVWGKNLSSPCSESLDKLAPSDVLKKALTLHWHGKSS